MMSNRTVGPGRALGVMALVIVVVPVYLYLSSLLTGGFEDSGPAVAAVVLTILTLMLAVVFLPVVAAVLAKDPIRPGHLGLFAGAMVVAHGLALVAAASSDSNAPLLAYPVVAVLAWLLLRDRA